MTMTQVFIACALLGGVLLVFQLLLSVLGLGGHHDVGGGGHDVALDHGGDAGTHDHGHGAGANWLLGFLTFRNLVAGLTFFGLVGMAATAAGWPKAGALAAALAAAIVAMAAMGLMMRAILKLEDDGTVDISRAVGLTGTVYVTVPGNKGGAGKVHVDLQNRTAEYQAVTFQGPLPTGARIVVVDVVGPDTLEVIAAPQYGKVPTHV